MKGTSAKEDIQCEHGQSAGSHKDGANRKLPKWHPATGLGLVCQVLLTRSDCHVSVIDKVRSWTDGAHYIQELVLPLKVSTADFWDLTDTLGKNKSPAMT
eukprot:1156649-Pelagomonas_calceolata.AAC.5